MYHFCLETLNFATKCWHRQNLRDPNTIKYFSKTKCISVLLSLQILSLLHNSTPPHQNQSLKSPPRLGLMIVNLLSFSWSEV